MVCTEPCCVNPCPRISPSPGIFFFSLVLFSNQLTPTMAALGVTPLMAAVLVGAAQNVFSKASAEAHRQSA